MMTKQKEAKFLCKLQRGKKNWWSKRKWRNRKVNPTPLGWFDVRQVEATLIEKRRFTDTDVWPSF